MLAIAAAGCDPGMPTGKLRGQVLLDGKPLTHGAVTSTTEFGDSQGDIGKDGGFQLSLLDRAGVVPAAHHRLAVIAYVGGDTPQGPEADAPLMIPYQYGNPETSGFEADVAPNEEVVVKLELSSKRK